MKSNLLVEGKIFGMEGWKVKMLWLPLIVVVGMVLGWFLVLYPRIGEVYVYNQEIKSTKVTVAELNQKINYLSSADDDELMRQEALVVEALPKNKDIYFMLTAVQNIASKYNYTVDSFMVSPGKIGAGSSTDKDLLVKTEAGVLEKVPLEVTLIGLQDDYLNLIDSLEKSLPLLSIDEFKMTTSTSNVKLDLKVATYFSSEMLDLKVNNLTLADLTLTKDELNTIETLSGFAKIENPADSSNPDLDKKFIKYERTNPFSL